MDSSHISMEPMKNHPLSEMIKTYQALINRLKRTGFQPKHHVLDDKASTELKQTIKDNGMTYQLVPPDDHRRNINERSIQTAKSHVISSVLCGVDPNFPMHLWDLLIPQMEIKLNLLRQSRTIPTISAGVHLHSPHDYNAYPLAPLCCAVEYHVKTLTRASWGTHALSGYYVGVSLEHYRCHKV